MSHRATEGLPAGLSLADPDPEGRVRALLAVRDQMLVAHGPSVVALLDDPQPAVRFAAAEVLGVLFAFLGEDDPPGCAEAVQRLLRALSDEPLVAEAAAIAVGRIGGRAEAVASLARAASHPEVGRAALAALLQQGEAALQAGAPLEMLVRRAGEMSAPAAVALTAMGPGTLPILARLLADDVAVRPILEGLHAYGRATSHLIPELTRFLWGPHGVAAVRLLLTLGADALAPLCEVLERGTPEVRRALLEGLRAPRPELVALLAQGLADARAEHRALAIEAIAAWGPDASFLVPEAQALASDAAPEVQAALRLLEDQGPL